MHTTEKVALRSVAVSWKEERMESRAKIMGHPLHPILIPFTLGLLSTSVVFDVVYLLTGNGRRSRSG